LGAFTATGSGRQPFAGSGAVTISAPTVTLPTAVVEVFVTAICTYTVGGTGVRATG
jgi:hypothetical protein